MKPLVDFVHGLGFKLGLYLSGGRHTCRGQVGSYGFYDQDAAAYLAWGADYVKEDWCDADGLDLHTELSKRVRPPKTKTTQFATPMPYRHTTPFATPMPYRHTTIVACRCPFLARVCPVWVGALAV